MREISCVCQSDAKSPQTEETVAEAEGSCEVEGQAAKLADVPCEQQASVASETTTRQTKAKKLSKKQLLAEQRRKDRVRTVFSIFNK